MDGAYQRSYPRRVKREVVGIEVVSEHTLGEGGFLTIRRVRLRNRRADDSLSSEYICDFVDRPRGLDAVVAVVYARDGDRVRVLLRRGLRPSLQLGRTPPLPSPFFCEVVAGILELSDGDAVEQRAADEVKEEAGFEVDAKDVRRLGATSVPAPGILPERLYLCAVEVDPATQGALEGDGSPMEEGATTQWVELEEAIAACVRGEIEDAKTELSLRRLRDELARTGRSRNPLPGYG